MTDWDSLSLPAKMMTDPIVAAARAMCAVLYGDSFDLHDAGAQDPEFRADLELAAEAAVRAYFEGQ